MDNIKIASYTSANSLSRGYDYFLDGRVIDLEIINHNQYNAKVRGNNKTYNVTLFLDKPRKSICDCPYCDGHPTRFCKHKVAVYLMVNPSEFKLLDEAYSYYESRYERYEKELKKQHDIIKKEVVKSVNKMSVKQLREEVIKHRLDFEYEYIDEQLRDEFDIDE